MKSLILVLATALPALSMPAFFPPGVYLSIGPWGSGESMFYDFSIADPEACVDLEEPVLRRAETFWLIGGDYHCYHYRTTCNEPCPDDECTALGPVKHSDEFMFDLSTVGWGNAIASFQCHRAD